MDIMKRDNTVVLKCKKCSLSFDTNILDSPELY